MGQDIAAFAGNRPELIIVRRQIELRSEESQEWDWTPQAHGIS
jgi:hypothetical protein